MMPGVVMMENGVRAPLPTNHDRDHGQFTNGNGGLATPDRQNGVLVGAGTMTNGKDGSNGANAAQPVRINTNPSRMNDLPDEIKHITDGFIPLSLLLSRLAQKTHSQLHDEIVALAKMPAPAGAVNGNSAHAGAVTDDVSPENLAKKTRLLNFVQEKHAEWVKAAVIARWSRNASQVSKLIDLMWLLNDQSRRYLHITDVMAEYRWSLAFARLPNPDLQTALEVLSTGTAPWMPDFNYIEPPPLTPKEQLQWIENLNTLLSIRLNLEDFDTLPYAFRDYTIDSGRVTFKVPGEFEVDLTIADEDFEKQFWFIDFRFDFTPAPAELSDNMRMVLEGKVNEVLEKDGLSGCYKFLHELVLTHKITEYVRQAFELSKGRWVDTLKVERLNRAMSIQYWVGRYPPEGPKSWIILGVNSGKKAGAIEDPKSASHLTLRWFRDNKEVKDVEVPLHNDEISTEDLLERVIGRHVEYILSSIHSKLKLNGRFTKREAGLALDIQRDNPARSVLQMQVGYKYFVTLGVSSTTGMLSMKPQSAMTWKGEQKLNWHSKDPIHDGLACLEGVRCHYIVDEINRRGKSTGWIVCKGPVKLEVVKEVLNLREMGQLMWLKRRGFADPWHMMVNLSLSGDKWHLIEVNNQPNGEAQISSYTKLPLSPYPPNLGDRFFRDLTTFSAAMISHITYLRSLHRRRTKYSAQDGVNYSLPPNMKVPAIYIKLSDILGQPQSDESHRPVAYWAHDYVEMRYRGVRNPSTKSQAPNAGDNETPQKDDLHTFIDARLQVSDSSRFGLLKGHVERDVAYHGGLGVFALRLEAKVGRSILDTLGHRLRAIDQLADCIDAIRRSDRDIQCEEITLTKIVFTYTDRLKEAADKPQSGRFKAILQLEPEGTKLMFERGNPQLRVMDHFRHLINSNLGSAKLPFYLSTTLPVHRALDAIEDAWEDHEMNNQGRVEIYAVHLDWFNIRYHLPGPNRNPNAHRRVTIQVRLRHRRGGLEWAVGRLESGPIPAQKPNDEFKQLLERVWNAENRTWICLVDSAATGLDHRIGDLMKAVDEAIRRVMTPSPTVARQPQPRVQGQQRNPAHAMYHRQMAANRPQSQAQGRAQTSTSQNAVVVLDE
ncbi:MED14-domain-containing protein [Hypoxylon trugodes]|uniref:MED14-domain-containing protein n=1 Tax=Hypoxylon trugodes TaxID=326681 RepID=UPI00219B6960|nr:MED14-domain-containing protein [Hypoxylon trugodes]KAI1394241.1 MED14-domain-containing protein [Hypoxylon trugodes]